MKYNNLPPRKKLLFWLIVFFILFYIMALPEKNESTNICTSYGLVTYHYNGTIFCLNDKDIILVYSIYRKNKIKTFININY